MSGVRLFLLLGLMFVTLWSLAATSTDLQTNARNRLVEQIHHGETIYRDDLVQDAAERLLRIDPAAKEALLAQIYLATRRGAMDQARKYLNELARAAPDSTEYAEGKALIELNSEASQKALAQARLLFAAGRIEEARKAYDAVLKGVYPTADLALEYWQLRARDPQSREQAVQALTRLLISYPKHPGLLLALANYSFADGHPDKGLEYLHTLATIPAQREAAAAREFDYLATLPVADRSARLWDDFVSRYTGTRLYSDARARLGRQRALLDDPVWRAGQQGIAMVEADNNAAAIRQLEAAVRAYPDDAEMLGALGLAYLRENKRALALKYFELAREKEPRIDAASRWVSLIESTKYWLQLSQADEALQKRDYARAQALYAQAHKLDPGNVFALVGLGDVALATKQDEAAWRYFRQAFDLNPEDSTAQRGIETYLATLPADVALARLAQFPASQQRYLAQLQKTFRIAQLEQKAVTAQTQGRWEEAAQWLSQAQALDLADPWLSYRLASALLMAGQPAQALQAYRRHLDRYPVDATSAYAYALLLESADQWQNGISALQSVPESQWTPEMLALQQRLQTRIRVAQAQKLYDDGDADGAIALLEQPPQNDALRLQVAEWALLQGNPQKALSSYQTVLADQPDNLDAQLGELEARVALGEIAIVRQQLVEHPPRIPSAQTNAQRQLAMLWAAVGERDKAVGILQAAIEQPGQASPLLYRDYARLVSDKEPDVALGLYRKAMEGSGLLAPPTADTAANDVSFTRAMRTPDIAQDWLQSSIRSDAAQLYQHNNPTLTLSTDGWFRNDGTPGLSQLSATTAMAQLDYPIASGKGFVRADYISMNAGSFNTTNSGEIDERFGTCIISGQTANGTSISLPGCRDVPTQKVEGTAFALGWQSDRWGFDIGHTPTSFPVSNWTGGINVLGDLGQVGWRLSVSRRPMANSLLSLAGAKDPRTGIVWGGVLVTGATLSLSWDEGLSDGVWGSIGYHKLTGTNVADNRRFRAMGGYYRRLINKPNEQMTVGVNAMYWSYQRDLGNFTLGQGGYYSPQMYASIGLPIGYARRWDDWAFLIQGSVSRSVARTSNSSYYPLMGAMPGPVNALFAQGVTPGGFQAANTSQGSTSSSWGYSLRGSLERRLGNHWVLGAAFDLQRGQDYMPSRFIVYLRYFFKPWAGDLNLQPAGLTPYVDFN